MIRQRKDRDGLQVQVYAGRDPLTGRKRYVSRQIPGTGRAAMKHAKQIEAQLLAEVGAGRHQRSAMTLAQLLDEWLTWRESNGKPISPATLHGYRLTVETKIKPALGYLPVAKIDARGAVAARYRGPGVGHGGLGAGGQAPGASGRAAAVVAAAGRFGGPVYPAPGGRRPSDAGRLPDRRGDPGVAAGLLRRAQPAVSR
jgi:hypothetical protein